jgi:2,3-bisphosphoglycerate-dependent phosphoglycerate mutase
MIGEMNSGQRERRRSVYENIDIGLRQCSGTPNIVEVGEFSPVAMPRMHPIYLIRHGETTLNVNRMLQPPETRLSEHGLEQVRRLGERLRAAKLARILTSDLTRAAMTAEAVCAATGAPLEVDHELRERNFGDLRGRSYDTLGFDPFADGYEPPGGENWEIFHARVARAWRHVLAVAAHTEGAVAVVTHGLVCRGVVVFHAPPAPGLAMPAIWRNASVSVLEGVPVRATLIDCVAHLGGAREDGKI